VRRFESLVCVRLVVLLAILVIPDIAHAQAGTASVFGDVKDQQGATLPGATVTLTSSETGAVRTTVTSNSGASTRATQALTRLRGWVSVHF